MLVYVYLMVTLHYILCVKWPLLRIQMLLIIKYSSYVGLVCVLVL